MLIDTIIQYIIRNYKIFPFQDFGGLKISVSMAGKDCIPWQVVQTLLHRDYCNRHRMGYQTQQNSLGQIRRHRKENIR